MPTTDAAGRRRNTLLASLVLIRRLAPGITVSEILAFLYVAENPGVRVKELAALMETTAATASRASRALLRAEDPGVLPPRARMALRGRRQPRSGIQTSLPDGLRRGSIRPAGRADRKRQAHPRPRLKGWSGVPINQINAEGCPIPDSFAAHSKAAVGRHASVNPFPRPGFQLRTCNYLRTPSLPKAPNSRVEVDRGWPD